MRTCQIVTMLREKRGMSQRELAEKMHVHPSLVSSWERGTRTTRPEHLKALADLFNVSVDYLMGRPTLQHSSEDEGERIPPAAWPLGAVVKVPVLSHIRAGEPLIAEDTVIAWEEVPSTLVKAGDYFLRVSDNSMLGARIAEGDLVLVRQQPSIEDGQIAVVMIGDKAVLKRVHRRKGQIILTSEAAGYEPILAPETETMVLGKVVKIWADPK